MYFFICTFFLLLFLLDMLENYMNDGVEQKVNINREQEVLGEYNI